MICVPFLLLVLLLFIYIYVYVLNLLKTLYVSFKINKKLSTGLERTDSIANGPTVRSH